jgi:glycogen synthase
MSQWQFDNKRLDRLKTRNPDAEIDRAKIDRLKQLYRANKGEPLVRGELSKILSGVSREELLASRDVPANAKVLFCVGRLVYEKGVQDAIAAMPAILAANPGAVLLIVGPDGGMQQHLEAQIHGLGLADRVRILGPIYHHEGLSDLAAGSDVGLVPSLYEAFGVVGNELSAVRLPLVASTKIGFVRDGENGLSVAPKDQAAIARAVNHLLRHPTDARRLATNAQEQAFLPFYHWNNIAGEEIRAIEARLTRLRAPIERIGGGSAAQTRAPAAATEPAYQQAAGTGPAATKAPARHEQATEPERIVHFAWEFPGLGAREGGLGSVVVALSAEQARAGHDVLVVTRRPFTAPATPSPRRN